MQSKRISNVSSRQRGFTLVEMAVVLVILGLFLGGLILPLSAQMEQRDRTITLKTLGEVREALIGYALSNRYLPCPDSKAIPDGIEDTRVAGACPQPEGTLPWQTLGVERTDAWTHYLHYRVTPAFSNNATLFSLSSTGAISVNSDTGELTTNAVAVILSYGSNGFGAKSTLQASPDNDMQAPTGTDELENTDLDATFISHTPTPQGSANEFDDMLAWLPQSLLLNRMVLAEQLP